MQDIETNTWGLAELILDELQKRNIRACPFAKSAGIPATTIYSILNRPNKKPELDTLASLARAFRRPLADLIEACGLDLYAVPAEQAA